MLPEAITLATAAPVMVPKSALAAIDTLPGAPVLFPKSRMDRATTAPDPPDTSSSAVRMMKNEYDVQDSVERDAEDAFGSDEKVIDQRGDIDRAVPNTGWQGGTNKRKYDEKRGQHCEWAGTPTAKCNRWSKR